MNISLYGASSNGFDDSDDEITDTWKNNIPISMTQPINLNSYLINNIELPQAMPISDKRYSLEPDMMFGYWIIKSIKIDGIRS